MEGVVPAAQDKTTLNDRGPESTEGPRSIGGRGTGAQGLMASFGLAVDSVGRQPGLHSLNADLRATEAELS